MDETKLSDDVREDGERVQVIATYRVVHPVEYFRQHQPVSHDVLDATVRIRLPSIDITGQVPLHPIGGHLRLAAVLDADEQHRGRFDVPIIREGQCPSTVSVEFDEQLADARLDLVADRSYRVERLAGWVR